MDEPIISARGVYMSYHIHMYGILTPEEYGHYEIFLKNYSLFEHMMDLETYMQIRHLARTTIGGEHLQNELLFCKELSLFWAVTYGNCFIARKLIVEYHAPIVSKYYVKSLLHIAATGGHLEIVKLLIEYFNPPIKKQKTH